VRAAGGDEFSCSVNLELEGEDILLYGQDVSGRGGVEEVGVQEWQSRTLRANGCGEGREAIRWLEISLYVEREAL
jgi:hypothetical protein